MSLSLPSMCLKKSYIHIFFYISPSYDYCSVCEYFHLCFMSFISRWLFTIHPDDDNDDDLGVWSEACFNGKAGRLFNLFLLLTCIPTFFFHPLSFSHTHVFLEEILLHALIVMMCCWVLCCLSEWKIRKVDNDNDDDFLMVIFILKCALLVNEWLKVEQTYTRNFNAGCWVLQWSSFDHSLIEKCCKASLFFVMKFIKLKNMLDNLNFSQ